MITISWFGAICDKNQRYKSLDDFDKKFLIPKDILSGSNLPGLLILSRIEGVSFELIPHIISRVNIMEGSGYLNKLDEWLNANHKPELAEYLQRFNGVTSNLGTSNTRQFLEAACTHYNIKPLTAEHARRSLSHRRPA